MISARLSFLSLGCALAAATAAGAPINRQALVNRHAVHVTRLDPESPLSVGNGDFAFTVDATGLQSLETLYHREGIPLETLSTWAWHSFPNLAGLRLEDAMKPYEFHGRTIKYAGLQHSAAGTYFRENPHPIPLGQISLLYQGRVLSAEDLGAIDQTLDLWTGVIRSAYTIGGQPVLVETVAHPELSQVAVKLSSPLIRNGTLQIRFRFPYSYQLSTRNKPPLVWDQPGSHRTTVVRQGAGFRQLERTLDDSRYYATVGWEGAG